MSWQDPSQLRISDDDRHRVAEFLREAAGEGRIDLTELDERLEQTYAAKTYADLVPITGDLPAPQGSVPVQRAASLPASGGARIDTSLAILSNQDRTGVWQISATHNAFALMGNITLDLRQAALGAPEVVINASAVLGTVKIVVNAGTAVVVEGVGVLGTFSETRARVGPDLGPGSPVVRVRGLALLGTVAVTRKPMPGERSRRFLGR